MTDDLERLMKGAADSFDVPPGNAVQVERSGRRERLMRSVAIGCTTLVVVAGSVAVIARWEPDPVRDEATPAIPSQRSALLVYEVTGATPGHPSGSSSRQMGQRG